MNDMHPQRDSATVYSLFITGNASLSYPVALEIYFVYYKFPEALLSRVSAMYFHASKQTIGNNQVLN